jgi:hypothetical protein
VALNLPPGPFHAAACLGSAFPQALAFLVIPGTRRFFLRVFAGGVALSFCDQLSRGGGLSSVSTKRRVDPSINSGLFIKQGLVATAVKADVCGFGGLVDLSKNKCNFRVIVPNTCRIF